MNSPSRILLIDDNPDDRLLAIRVLRREFPDLQVRQVTGAEDFAPALEAGDFDLTITDYQLYWSDGLVVLRAVKARYPDRPVIMFTATGSEEIAVEAMKAGLNDYVLKSPKHFAHLPVAARSALRAEDTTERKQTEEEVRRRSEELETLREISLAITAQLELDELLQNIVEQGCRLLDVRAGGVYLVDETRGDLELIVSHGYARDYTGTRLAPGDGIAGKVLQSGAPLIVDDYHHWEGRSPDWEAEPLTTVLGVPLKRGEQVIGVLNFDETAPARSFDEHDVRLATLFASQATIAIENARLYEQARREIAERKQAEAALRESEQRFRDVARTTGDWIWEVDAEGCYTYASPVVEQVLGYTPKEVLGKHYYDFFHPDAREELETLGQETFRRKEPFVRLVNPNVHKDGHTVILETTGLPLTDAEGNLLGYRGVDRDVTAPVRSEEILRALNAAAAAVQRAAHTPEAVFTAVMEQLKTLGLTGAVVLLDEAREQFIIRYATVASRTLARAEELVGLKAVDYTFPVERLPIGRQILAGETVFVPDAAALLAPIVPAPARPPMPTAMRLLGMPRGVVAPLSVEGEIIGFLGVSAARLTEADTPAVTAFANQMAAALENARLYQAEQRRRQEAETLRETALALTTSLDRNQVIERILIQLREVVPYDSASVQLLQDDHLEIIGGHGFPNLEELLGVTFDLTAGDNPNREVMRTRAPLILEDAPTVYSEFDREPHARAAIRSWLGAPMLVGEQPIGMIALDKREPGFYTEEHARLAQAFAAQAAVAIENARLYDETRRRLAREQRLNELAHTLGGEMELATLVPRLLPPVAELAGADAGTAAVFDPDRNVITHPYNYNLPDTLAGVEVPAGSGLAGHTMQVRRPMLLDDYREHPAALQPWVEAGVRSLLTVPLLAGDEAVGALGLFSLGKVRPFGPEAVAAAEAAGRLAAVAIQRARLFEAEREQRELAEALEEAAAAVSSTLDPDQVLDRILEQVERVVPGDAFNVMLIENSQVRIVRWRGYEHLGVDEQIASSTIPITEYPNLSKMVQTGEPVVIPDTAADPNWAPLEGQEWRRSYVAAPIRVKDQTVGFLNVVSTRPGQFGPADARRLEAFASHAATAIENAGLYGELRNHAEQLEQRVQERTAQLQAQYARLDTILRSATDGIIVTGAGGEIIQANPVAQAWLTRTLSPEDAARLREAVRDLARRALCPGGATGRAGEGPETVLELTGLDLELNAAPISEWGADGMTAVVAVHDVSHLKALDRIKSRFVTNISHELRTPIATIKLYVDLMRRTPLEKWKKYIDTLEHETDWLIRLVEDILQISEIDTGRLAIEPRLTSLNDLTEVAFINQQSLAREHGLTLEHHPAEPGPVALVDTEWVMQALNNLVWNAILYTPEGGKVMVSTGEEEAEGRVWATMTVADTGMGIPEEELPHIFERFFRGEEPRQMQISGTGLGLSIVEEIAELHGGRVTVESQVGVGSTFTIWLPVSD